VPGLVYGRMTGWGQTGPLSQRAGHDINYIALSGALHAIGPKDGKPMVPLNLVGDLGGGALYLALGVTAALIDAQRSGKGQVVDAAMIDGAASLMSMFFGFWQAGTWSLDRGANFIDGAAHYYDTFETSDGKWLALGAVEPQFYAALRETLDLTDEAFDDQHERANWPALKERLARIFRTRTQAEWCEIFDDSDACVTPVLSIADAPQHPHNLHRQTFVSIDGVVQPNAAPRFSRTSVGASARSPIAGEHTRDILQELGLSETIVDLEARQVIRTCGPR
jgi:alpha-methylacyl-CoA racemase